MSILRNIDLFKTKLMKFVQLWQIVILITFSGAAILFSGCNTELVAKPELDWQQEDGTDQKSTTKKPMSVPRDSLPADIDLKSIPLGLPKKKDIPKENPLTKASVVLGRKLFFDAKLSADGTVACATCHRPEHGFASPEKLSVGVGGKVGKRNSPSLFNRVYGQSQFWDGRAKSLEEQSLIPIESELELANSIDAVLKYLKSSDEYVVLFSKAFGKKPDRKNVTAANLGKALASFQRTLLHGDSIVDRFQSGRLDSTISAKAKQGLWIFESRGGCWKCHSGPNYADEKFHNTGVSFGTKDRDFGRFDATGNEIDKFKFKTPTLRGVASTGPFMHDGSMKSLQEVVEFYNKGGNRNDKLLSDKIKPLNLPKDDLEALVEFLKALSQRGQ